MLLPSKKLLKEVLKDRFKDVVIDGCVISEKNDNTLKIFMNICFCYEINIYELAFLIRDYFHKKYKHDLDMSLEINEIFKNATQFYESVL